MSELTMYHVTDASNVDEIMTDGLQPSADGMVYLTETVEDAAFLGDVYPTVDDAVVLKATVLECHVDEGPGDAGDVDEYVKHGAVMPVDLEVVDR